MSRTRVAVVDASRMSPDRTGIENYLHHLLPPLADAWTRRSAARGSEGGIVVFAREGWIPPASHNASIRQGGGLGWTQARLPLATRAAAADVYFSPIPILPLLWPMPCPAVVTVHDFHEFRPRWAYFRRLLSITFGRAAAIVCVSDASREELAREFPGAAAKSVVVREAADAGLYRPREVPGRPTEAATDLLRRLGVEGLPLLAVGTIQPRKNYATLLRAYARALELGAPLPDLVIAGRPGWDYQETLDLPAQLGIEKRVHFAGHLPEADLAELVRSALVLCAVSTAEGFGLPVVEAMFSGVPILASDIPPFREVAGTAARFVRALDVDSMADAMHRLVTDEGLRRDLSEAGLGRRSLFSWERAGAEVAGVMDRVARA